MTIGDNLRAVRDQLEACHWVLRGCTDERIDNRYYNWELHSGPHGRLLAVQIISRITSANGVEAALERDIEHFDVWTPIDHSNKMENILDAIKLYAECPTEDTGWLMVLRRLRQKTAAIKHVLLGAPKDANLNRSEDGINAALRKHDILPENEMRWAKVLNAAINESYVEPYQAINSSGQYFAADGTMMNADGTRSIFDDVDQ